MDTKLEKLTLTLNNDISFQRRLPNALLASIVAWYWQMDGKSGQYIARDEFMHPEGAAHITFNFGKPLRLSHGFFKQGISIEPPPTGSLLMTLEGDISSFGILLKPGAAFTLLGTPTHGLLDLEEQQYPSLLRDLFDKLSKKTLFSERVSMCEDVLVGLMSHASSSIPNTIMASLNEIKSSHGMISMSELANTMCLGQRQLERKIKDHLGLTAKQYACNVRITHARNLIKKNIDSKLVDIAMCSGYYDQSHFNREFSRVIGLTPSKYKARCENSVRNKHPLLALK